MNKSWLSLLLMFAPAMAFSQRINIQSSLQNAQPWVAEQDIWANGPHCATFGFDQGMTSPSLSGSSTDFTLSGPSGCGYSNALFHYSWNGFPTASKFQLDTDIYVDNPMASQTVEFAVLQRHGHNWYKFSTQCSYANGWRTWAGGQQGHWSSTAVPCKRFAANTWTHLRFEYEIVAGQTHFIAVTVGGIKHHLNTYGVPEVKSGLSEIETVHFQMGGNKYQDPWSAWLDNVTVKTVF
jgi:hypothetical protein